MSRLFAFVLVFTGVLLSGCLPQKNASTSQTNIPQNSPQPTSTTTGTCKEESVIIEGYGDPGKRLKNCFVEYPGEPSRQDKSYYVVEDVCGQFTPEFIQNALGKPITKIQKPDHDTLFNCRYFYEEDKHVLLVFEYLKIENQVKGNKEMGRRVEADSRIPMRNYVVWQEDGLLNNIYLVLDDAKFISLNRSDNSGLSSDDLINFASKIATEIKNYK